MRTERIIAAALFVNLVYCVAGDYQALVTLYSYSNPNNTCAACRDNVLEPFGCCDNHRVKDPNACASVETRLCEIRILVCLVEQGSLRRGEQCPSRSVIFMSDFDLMSPFNPPLRINSTGRVWGDYQLYIVMNDDDFGSPTSFDLVDSFAPNLEIGTDTSRTTLRGTFGLATIDVSFSLVCINNYYGPDCSLFCEQPPCSCDPGFTGEFCQTDIDDCVSVTCSGRGVCVDGVNSYTCDCDPGFTGTDCTLSQAQRDGAIAGGVVAGLLIVILAAIVVVVVLMSRTKQHKRKSKLLTTTADSAEVHENVYQLNPGFPERELDNPVFQNLKDELS